MFGAVLSEIKTSLKMTNLILDDIWLPADVHEATTVYRFILILEFAENFVYWWIRHGLSLQPY